MITLYDRWYNDVEVEVVSTSNTTTVTQNHQIVTTRVYHEATDDIMIDVF